MTYGDQLFDSAGLEVRLLHAPLDTKCRHHHRNGPAASQYLGFP
jgi:hypothetical protein